MPQVFAAPYVPVTVRASCDFCDSDSREIRAIAGPDPQEWTCEPCYLGGMPGPDFQTLELVQEKLG